MPQRDQAGCGHYRQVYPAESAAGNDEIEVAELQQDWKGVTNYTSPQGYVTPVGVNEADLDVDLVVMSRPLRRFNVEMIQILQEHGVAVVIDVDDDFSCIHPKHFAARLFQKKHSPDSNNDWLAYGCSIADMVTVTTPALAER